MTDIKARFIKKLLLVLSDSEKSYILETNVLDYAMRGILRQKIDGKLHPVVFYFRKFINVKLNYEIHDKKLLAIIAILKK